MTLPEPEILIAPPEVEIDSETSQKLKEEVLEEKQVIVHCSFNCPAGVPQLIRIWKTTFLVDKHSSHRSSLIHHENISLYPYWTVVEGGQQHTFTLIFSGLPSTCTVFDFLEDIPQSGGFHVPSIPRNKMDVYHINIS